MCSYKSELVFISLGVALFLLCACTEGAILSPGEATQLVIRYVEEKEQETNLRWEPECLYAPDQIVQTQNPETKEFSYQFDGRSKYWTPADAEWHADYKGNRTWLVTTDVPEAIVSTLVRNGIEKSLLKADSGTRTTSKDAFPNATWRVYETTKIVVAVDVPDGC